MILLQQKGCDLMSNISPVSESDYMRYLNLGIDYED